jgi:hypothetical protein
MMMSAPPSPNPVPEVGHFNRTLLGHFWRAAKDGVYGIRFAHNTDVTVTGLTMTKD